MLRLLTRTGIVWPVPAAGPAPSATRLPGGDHGPRAAIQRARNLARSAPAVTCARDDSPGEWRLNSRRESGGCHVIASHIPVQAQAGPAAVVTAGYWPAGQAGDFPRPGSRRRDAGGRLPGRFPVGDPIA